MNQITAAQKQAVLGVIAGVLDVIPAQGMPEGHLYAMLMGHMNLNTFQQIMSLLVKTGKISISGHYITKL
jgi:hypothetical protein